MSRDGGKFVFYQKRNVQEFIRRNCPLPHESYHGILQLSEYSKISIQLTGWAKEFLLRPQPPTAESYWSQAQPSNLIRINKSRNALWYGGIFVSYKKRNVQEWFGAIAGGRIVTLESCRGGDARRMVCG